MHDIGKCSGAFQTYIGAPEGGRARGPDHSTAGAREVVAGFCAWPGHMLAAAIAGHHAGLPDFDSLKRRLDTSSIEPYPGWQAEAGTLPAVQALSPTKHFGLSPRRGFMQAFLTRMLFSCLVDADWIATERFYAGVHGEAVERGNFPGVAALRDRLRAHMAGFRTAAPRPVNQLRNQVLDHAIGKAALPPGLFTLTVPTGGGKTLASLAFALEHAAHHGMRRVVMVIPYTSIIEQTASVYRDALGEDAGVLEHHASFDWERAETVAAADSEGPDGLAKLRRAAENWDATVVVTTALQFFESLFANGRARCRKLHNLAGAVIVLDEAQTLPLPLLHPCLAALDELARNYGASVVLCTATQPAIRSQDGFKHGLDIPAERELAPDPAELYGRLRRVRVEQAGDFDDAALAERFAAVPQMLCIVNSRAHATDLFKKISDMDGAMHLTTLMVPRHRRAVLADIKARLLGGKPVRLVATSLIEAGVDVDFPEVWRALSGLDSIAQAAGRCNREGRLALGRVVVFKPIAWAAPRVMIPFADAATGVLTRHEDPLSLDAIRDYFSHLYWLKGPDAFDAARLDGKRYPILTEIADRARSVAFPFESIARAFRMIDEAMASVIVPWKSDPDDDHALAVLRRISGMERPRREDLRALQQYVVPIPRAAKDDWLAKGVLRPVHTALGEALLTFADDALYDRVCGLRLFDPAYRNAERNIA
jgi:CRISPR-associated endonuclease/helicase Cas3